MNNYFLVATLLVTSVALYAGCGSCPSACSSTKSTCAATTCESKDECKKSTKACTTDACDTKEEATEEEAE